MSRVIETNEIKEEFDDVLETPLANFPFDFDVSSESVHEPPSENDDQNCTAKLESTNDDSMTEVEEEENASKAPTGSNHQNLTKRKQSQSNQSFRKTKKTGECEGEENIASEDRVDDKFAVLHLNCTQPDCDDKLDTLHQLHEHLGNKHGLLPLQCFCGCKSGFENSRQISLHLQDRSAAKFSCLVCTRVFKCQNKAYQHWFMNHQTGQFQCNIDHCSKVVDTRNRLRSHQQFKHCPESKRFQCPHDGCSASFVHKNGLKAHEIVHLNTKPFQCTWPKCVYCTNDRSTLIRHIRNVHFKKQQKNGIAGECDPKKYVRVAKK